MIDERQNILTRIREALRVPAPRPGSHTAEQSEAAAPAPGVSAWLPLVGPSEAERVELFRKNSLELTTDFRELPDPADLPSALQALAAAEGWTGIATHRGPLTDRGGALGLPTLFTDGPYDVHALETCSAGITGCDALIAQTGSVLITNRSAGGRALSALPPHHVVLATRAQLLPDLPGAFALLKERYASGYPSFQCLITGPSRTGDIERILVLGAHGPRKLTVFLC